MSFKETVNSVLYRATGLRLTSETPEERRDAIKRAERTAARRARERTADRHRRKALEREARHQKQLAQQKERLEERRLVQRKLNEARRESGDNLPTHLDDVTRRIIAKVSPRTMTGAAGLESLVEATRYVVHHRIPGEIVECGVWRGGGMQAVALALLSLGDSSRELHLFDTFEGMPPPTAEDTRRQQNGETVAAAAMLAEAAKTEAVWSVAGLDDVREGMADTGYPADKVRYHVGMVEETTPGEAPEQIAILRLDTDWYASTKHELETLYERLSPGGVLMIDDYADWDGARKATDEWLEISGEVLFLIPMGTGRIAVKPVAG
ncbi:MAG: class I SAM-dependent methyltransferase [Acidimicrobiaceae bacterium]|nr:class I SAM-dependent methyltransferase [Acidimicrobiaceae bacterium]